MPTIKLKLNTDSINQALKEVKAYQRKVEQAPQKLIEYLTAQGVEIAKMNVSDMNAYDSGELYNTAHAAFVCFGTGIVGKNNQHPNIAIAGWKYDVNDHGELGWWYIGRDGRAHWTKGMPSRPYMYNTAQQLRQMVIPAAKEALK